jgi:hypothetical protein
MAVQLISKYGAQKKIALAWFIMAGIYIILFLIIGGYRTDPGKSTDHIEWMINFLSPSLTMITTAFIYSAANREVLEQKNVDVFFFRLIFCISLFYFGFLLTILLLTASADRNNIGFMTHLKRFSLVLGFLQTIIVGLLGIFFVKENSASHSEG